MRVCCGNWGKNRLFRTSEFGQSSRGPAAEPFPKPWNGRRQRHDDLAGLLVSGYDALQLHRITGDTSS